MNTFVIIGGGPSLTPADVEYCRGRAKVIVINTAYQIAPWANYLYARDFSWWSAIPEQVYYPEAGGWTPKDNDQRQPHYVLSHRMFQGQRWTGCRKASSEYGLLHIDTRMATGLNPIPGVIHEGGPGGANSGFQATNLAITQFHATKILLLGFDMFSGHWHGDHPSPCTNLKPNQMAPFAESFGTMGPALKDMGIEVVNCAPKSAITCFRFSTLQAELPAKV